MTQTPVDVARLRALLASAINAERPERFEGPAYDAAVATGLVKTRRVAEGREERFNLTVCGVYVGTYDAWTTTATANAITFALSRILPALLDAAEERDRLRKAVEAADRFAAAVEVDLADEENRTPLHAQIGSRVTLSDYRKARGGAPGKDTP